MPAHNSRPRPPMRGDLLSSSPDRMVGALMLREIGIIELGERSIRKFFEHRMKTYAAALAYRGLFGLFPFVLILVVLAGLLGFADFFDRLVNQTGSGTTQQVSKKFEPVGVRGRELHQPPGRRI